jgi:hypothetical protein
VCNLPVCPPCQLCGQGCLWSMHGIHQLTREYDRTSWVVLIGSASFTLTLRVRTVTARPSSRQPMPSNADLCRFDAHMREVGTGFPVMDTVFDYIVDPSQRGWVLWGTRLPTSFKCGPPSPHNPRNILDRLRISPASQTPGSCCNTRKYSAFNWLLMSSPGPRQTRSFQPSWFPRWRACDSSF